ncbi:MAG: transposase [Planctomycetia bacterium]
MKLFADVIYTRNMTGAVFVEFLEAWTAESRKKLYLIVDRHPSHRSGPVREWLAARADRVRVFHLPAHAPEVNPVECANQDLKANVFKSGYPTTMAELRGKVNEFMEALSGLPEKVASYFRHPEVQYT